MSRTLRILSGIFPQVRRLVETQADLKSRQNKSRELRERDKKKIEKLQTQLADAAPWVPERFRPQGPAFRLDGFSTAHTPGFLEDPAFINAYQAGVQTIGEDLHWPWRVHVCLWLANEALSLPGDFIEYGSGRGFLSSAIMQHFSWERSERLFWMFDTFQGLVDSQISAEERAIGRRSGTAGNFRPCWDQVYANFGHLPNVRLVRGAIPETLDQLTSSQIAFCSIDMNCAEPEILAGEFIWSRLTPGAFVILDDYCNFEFEPQRVAWNQFAERHQIQILSLPTGQGLWRKPLV